jgi:hypothetical protein
VPVFLFSTADFNGSAAGPVRFLVHRSHLEFFVNFAKN